MGREFQLTGNRWFCARMCAILLLGGSVFAFASTGGCEPGDIDLNGSLDSADRDALAAHLLGIAPLTGQALMNADANLDGTVDAADLLSINAVVFAPPRLLSSSPKAGEDGVAVSRETILTFDRPLAMENLTEGALFARFGGEILPALLHLSPDGKTVTMFYPDPLPASARIRVTINGALLRSEEGTQADGDLNGSPGGVGFIDFDTLSLTSVPNTVVFGRVFASELRQTGGVWMDVPLEGVTIAVDGKESEIFAVTDAQGNYRLENAPVGRFFVHLDGHTVQTATIDGATTTTHFPEGPYYPSVSKTFEARAGQENPMMDMYLPLVPRGALVPLDVGQETVIGFPQSVLDEFPEFEGVHITVPAGSLYSNDGMTGGMVGMAPVAPDRIPGGLPEDLQLPIVISIQTDGATNFDTPVPVCFPNVPNPMTGQSLPAGSKSALWSFNHDTGEFEIVGPMTVSADGTLVCSDPGFGIKAPGWHGSQPGASGQGGDVNEQCAGPRGANASQSLIQRAQLGPIAVTQLPQRRFRFTIPIPANPPGPVVWSAPGGSPASGSGFVFETAFCSFGDQSVSAILADTCGGGTENASTSVLIDQSNIADDELESIQLISPGGSGPFAPGTSLIFRAVFANAGVSNTPNGSLVYQATGGIPASQTASAASTGSSNFITRFCGPGNYIVSAQFQSICGITSSAAVNIQIESGPPFCEVPHYIPQLDFILEDPINGGFAFWVRMNPFPLGRNSLDLGDQLLISSPDMDAGLAFPGMITGTGQQLPVSQIAFGQPGNKTITIELRTACGASCIDTLHINLTTPPRPAGLSLPLAVKYPSLRSVQFDPGRAKHLGDAIAAESMNLGWLPLYRRLQQDASLQPVGGRTYFAVRNLNNSFVSRGQGGTSGVLHIRAIRLAADTDYEELVLHGPTLRIASAHFTTPGSGSEFEIPGFTLAPDTSPDADGDGLGETGEFILGTDPNNPDSDSDGVNDGPEVQQGLNPLDGLPVPTGIVASVDTPGESLDICTADNMAVIADGSAGVTIFNIFEGLNPVRVAQIDTPGNAKAVAFAKPFIAVADGPGGLGMIALTDPDTAAISRQIAFEADAISVAAAAGLAFVGLKNGTIVVVEMATGLELARLTLASSVEDLVLGGNFLYAHEADLNGRVSAIPLDDPFHVAGSALPSMVTGGNFQNRQRIFAGGGLLYSVHPQGYSTFDISIPDLPAAIASSLTGQFGWKQIVLNGSGLGVAAAGLGGGPDLGNDKIHIYDTSNPALTDQFLAQLDTPGIAHAVSIFNGIAYIADGPAGMQEINYLAYDTGDTSPTISLRTNFSLGMAEEGQIMTITADVGDDVQVRNVEFFVDGVKAATDGNFPFEHRLIVPRASVQPAFTIQGRARDTGGNAATSPLLTLTVTNDATPPRVVFAAPRNLSTLPVGIDDVSIVATFNEPIDPATLTEASFQLIGAGPDQTQGTDDDVVIPGGLVAYNPDSNTASLNFPHALAADHYRAVVTTAVTDFAVHALASDFSWTFTLREPLDVFWITPDTGLWSDGVNWSIGMPPLPNDRVFITLDNPLSVLLDRNVEVGSLTLGAPGTLSVDQFGNPDQSMAQVLRFTTQNSSAHTLKLREASSIVGKGYVASGSPGAFEGPGLLTNEGYMNLGNHDVNGPFLNRARIDVSGAVRFNGPFENGIGGNLILTGDLTLQDGFSNSGRIDVQRVLNVLKGTVVNLGQGVIILNGGPGGLDDFGFEFDNRGRIECDSYTLTRPSANHRNSGVILVQSASPGNGLGLPQSPDGSFTNSGAIVVNGDSFFRIDGGTVNFDGGSIIGAGQVQLGAISNPQRHTAVNLNANLPNPSATLSFEDATIEGPGMISNEGLLRTKESRFIARVENHGMLEAEPADFPSFAGSLFDQGFSNAPGATLQILPSGIGALTATFNTGLLNHGTLDLFRDLDFQLSMKVTGGDLVNAPGGLIEVTGTNLDSNVSILEARVDNQGTMMIGGVLRLPHADDTIQNSGSIQIPAGIRLTLRNGATLTNLASGTLYGAGTLDLFPGGIFSNGGTVSPGTSPGTFSINGAYPQTGTGSLTIEIGGVTAGTEYDRLAVTGAATLAGVLNITLIDGFEPNFGDSFSILTSGARTGAFDVLNGLAIGNGKQFTLIYSGTGVTLGVIAGP